ncbi:MAG: allophanate hydrolase-related protein [Gammaproteobacteria bacterium]
MCGAHRSGLPLNGDLLRLGARFLGPARTAPHYPLYFSMPLRPRGRGSCARSPA